MGRWPGWIYDAGEEPDYRFSLSNERTLLAWIRTSLGLIAAGVAVDAVHLGWRASVQTAVAAVLVGAGMLAAAWSLARWARSERAMRLRQPLPSGGEGIALAVGIALVGVVVLLSLWA